MKKATPLKTVKNPRDAAWKKATNNGTFNFPDHREFWAKESLDMDAELARLFKYETGMKKTLLHAAMKSKEHSERITPEQRAKSARIRKHGVVDREARTVRFRVFLAKLVEAGLFKTDKANGKDAVEALTLHGHVVKCVHKGKWSHAEKRDISKALSDLKNT